MQKKLYLALILSALPIASGCNGQSASQDGGTVSMDAPPPPTVEAHAHPSEGPHHGALIELGNEEFHAEIVHTNDTVTVYILDRSATKPVPVDAQEVTINVVHENQPEQFKLAAAPEGTDGPGKSSRFTLQDAELVQHLDDPSASPKFAITINGTPYRGDVQHDHDGHDHHEHSHGELGHDKHNHDGQQH